MNDSTDYLHEEVEVLSWLLPRLYEKLHPDHSVEWDSVIPVNSVLNRPKQINGDDCGVFVMKFMDFMLQDYEIDSFGSWPQELVDTFRYRIAKELQAGKARPISNERMRKRLEID